MKHTSRNYFLSVKTIIGLFLVGISNLQCDCKKLFIKETDEKKPHDHQMDVAQIKLRGEELRRQMRESARLAAIAERDEEEARQKRREKREAYSKELALAKEKLASLTPKSFFIPSYSIDDVEQMQVHIGTFKKLLARESASGPLSAKLQQKAQGILSKISQKRAELKLVYKDLKHSLSQPSVAAPEEYQEEKEHATLVKKLLGDLQRLEAELRDILAARKEDLPSYEFETNSTKTKDK